MKLSNQQLRKKYHKQLVHRSQAPGHPKVSKPGSTKNFLAKAARATRLHSRKQPADVGPN